MTVVELGEEIKNSFKLHSKREEGLSLMIGGKGTESSYSFSNVTIMVLLSLSV